MCFWAVWFFKKDILKYQLVYADKGTGYMNEVFVEVDTD